MRAPSVACEYCGANNFLDDKIARDAAALLADERAEHERRARGGAAVDAAVYLAPARAFYRWGAAGAAIGMLIGVLFIA